MRTSCVAPLGVGESLAYPEREEGGERERERVDGREGGRGGGRKKRSRETKERVSEGVSLPWELFHSDIIAKKGSDGDKGKK